MFPSSSSSSSSGSLFNTRQKEFKDCPELWSSDTDSQRSLGWYPPQRKPFDSVSYWIKKEERRNRKPIDVQNWYLPHLFAAKKDTEDVYSIQQLFKQDISDERKSNKDTLIFEIERELNNIKNSFEIIFGKFELLKNI